jgi:hypothetical protein
MTELTTESLSWVERTGMKDSQGPWFYYGQNKIGDQHLTDYGHAGVILIERDLYVFQGNWFYDEFDLDTPVTVNQVEEHSIGKLIYPLYPDKESIDVDERLCGVMHGIFVPK